MHLVVGHVPGQQVMGQGAPWTANSDHLAQTVKHFAERVGALRGTEGHQYKIGSDKSPFFVVEIIGVRFPNRSRHFSGFQKLSTDYRSATLQGRLGDGEA